MSQSISPVVGAAPQYAQAPQATSLHEVLAGGANLGGNAISSSDYGIPSIPDPGLGIPGVTGPAPTAGQATGGGAQAVQGAAAVNPEQLIPVLQNLVSTITQLIAALQAQGVTGGGAPGGAVGQCGMAGCTMDHGATQAAQGASGAPSAPAAQQSARQGARATSRGDDPPKPADPKPAARVAASSVKDKSSTNGLSGIARRGLEEAHTFGLPLVSGARPGGPSSSDHTHGNAVDVGTLPIGSPSSTGGTPQMKAYAEHMRQEGKAGRLDVKYVIHDGKIASATNDWAWRDYTYPGKSAAQMEAMKSSNRGEYNRMQHYDHVHVSFG